MSQTNDIGKDVRPLTKHPARAETGGVYTL